MSVDVNEEVQIERQCCKNDGETPAMTQSISEDGIISGEPAPISAHGLIGVKNKTSETY